MTAPHAHRSVLSGFAGSVTGRDVTGPACAVRLIDRRTGEAHRVNGTPLVVFTRQPSEAVAELLAGRDPKIWEARIDPIEREGKA